MMDNAQLATASLLAKKLATPNTKAVFDFRVGPSGNIGRNLTSARHTKRLFIRIAQRLGITVDVVLTENRVFPSSALGRIESLDLLWQILSNRNLLHLDKTHLALCLEISTRACVLANRDARVSGIKRQLENLLRTGRVKRLFLRHVQAQGGNVGGLKRLLRARQDYQVSQAVSPTSGYWHPPNLNQTKEWLKAEQARLTRLTPRAKPIRRLQIGLRLCCSPGEQVSAGDKVLELRYPLSVKPRELPEWIVGHTTKKPCTQRPQVLG